MKTRSYKSMNLLSMGNQPMIHVYTYICHILMTQVFFLRPDFAKRCDISCLKLIINQRLTWITKYMKYICTYVSVLSWPCSIHSCTSWFLCASSSHYVMDDILRQPQIPLHNAWFFSWWCWCSSWVSWRRPGQVEECGYLALGELQYQ